MKLIDALELGDECGLDLIEEAITNVEIHAGSLFLYTEMRKELDELYTDFYHYRASLGSDEDTIQDAIKKLKEQENEVSKNKN